MKLRKITALSLAFAFSLGSCKKDQKTEPTTPPTVAQSDQQGSSAADSGLDDVNDFVNNKIGGGSSKRMATYDLPCGVVSVDSTVNSNGKKSYTFKYGSKSPCGYKFKSGLITFSLIKGKSFADTGAVNAVTFVDYTVQSNATNDIIKINGTLYTTNVNGGYIWQVILNGRTIVHSVRGNIKTLYGNGSLRDKNYFQLKTWTSSGGWAGLSLNFSGDTLINNIKVSETGKTLDGNYDYRTEILDNFRMSNCGSNYAGPFVMKNGKARMQVSAPNVSPAYFEVEAGYYFSSGTGTLKNDCSSNAYKLTRVVGNDVKTEYQLY